MKSGSKVKAWFEKLIKDLRAILDKAYNILKGQKSWEQMELIRNNKQTLDMIADYYFEGMEGTRGKAANGDGGARYSIQTTENGKQYVEADRNVISGDNPSEWARQVEDYINNEIRHGRDVTVYSANGVPLTITADTAGKATFRNFVTLPDGSKRPMTDSEYSVKLRAESHIDELAQVSRGTGTRKVDKKNHSFARDGFDYRKAYFKDHTGYYELLISVGKQGRINTVYNVGRIKEADFPTMGLKGPTRSKTETRNTASIDNMPQSSENVKLSAKDSGADIREVNPMEITPPNRVTSSSKYHYLINEFENNGYNGRRVVLVENGNDGYQALTGSHRILAAREAGVDVPSVVIPMSEEIQPLLDATGDEERARIADELYEDGITPKEARDLLVREDELNFENLGKPLDKQVRFSRKDDVSVTPEDAKKLQKQNDKLKQALEVAKQEIKLSDGHHVKASAVERLAGKLLKEYSSKMDKAELVSNITELFDYIGNGENVVWDEVQAGAMNIALNVLDQSAKRNTEWYDNTKPAREFLFQSTLPTRGSDLSILFSVRDFFTFQSTLPTRGSDNGVVQVRPLCRSDVNPRSPRGGATTRRPATQNCAVFQSTLPTRGSDSVSPITGQGQK